MKRIHSIMLLISILAIAVFATALTLKTTSAQGFPGAYYTIENVADNTSSITMGPSPAVGQQFTVAIKLYNATTANVGVGVGGVEVHITWNNTLIEPVSFVDKLGKTGGVLTGPGIIDAIQPGFFDSGGNAIATAPYSNATFYEVAAASTTGPWWGDGAEIAEITFKVDLQPQPWGTCPIGFAFADLDDVNSAPVTHHEVNATYTITTTTTTSETVTYNTVNYPVSIASDSIITAPTNLGFVNNTDGSGTITFNVTSPDGYFNATVPNDFMWGTWTVQVDGAASQIPVVTTDSANAYVWFNWTGAGNHVILLRSSNAVPEFGSPILMLFLTATALIATATAISFKRRKLHR
jgi:hypothetical protein